MKQGKPRSSSQKSWIYYVWIWSFELDSIWQLRLFAINLKSRREALITLTRKVWQLKGWKTKCAKGYEEVIRKGIMNNGVLWSMWTFFWQKITSNKIEVDQRDFLALQDNVIFLTQKTMAYDTYVRYTWWFHPLLACSWILVDLGALGLIVFPICKTLQCWVQGIFSKSKTRRFWV